MVDAIELEVEYELRTLDNVELENNFISFRCGRGLARQPTGQET